VTGGGGLSGIDVADDDKTNVDLFFSHFEVVCDKKLLQWKMTRWKIKWCVWGA